MAYMQRRIGPNNVAYVGLFQAIADAVKLLVKEVVYPNQSNALLFWISPVVRLFISLVI